MSHTLLRTQTKIDNNKIFDEKIDDEKAQPGMVTDSKTGANAEDASGKKRESDIIKTNAATLDITKQLREKLKESSISALPDVGSSSIDEQLKEVLSQLKSLSFSVEDKTTEQEVAGFTVIN